MKKKILAYTLAVLTIFILRSAPFIQLNNLPDELVLFENEAVSAVFNSEYYDLSGLNNIVEQAKSTDLFKVNEDRSITGRIPVKFHGIVVKNIDVKILPDTIVNPGGLCVGVAMYTKGVIIAGNSDITYEEGKKRNPALEAGLQPGDIILKVDGHELKDAKALGRLVEQTKSKNLELEIKRGNNVFSVVITPCYDYYEKKHRLGLWLRDSTAGIGTITFSEPSKKTYVALGHAIADPDTGVILPVGYGEIVECVINDIEKGKKGLPGELKGSFKTNAPAYGNILENSEYGIFGETYKELVNSLYPNGLPLASRNSVKEGKATILTTVDKNGIQEYEIQIIKANRQDIRAPKSMVIQITDERLLEKTGGIVQGMSGSPIIQNGKIIGAVTHVLISDPTKGYGIYADWLYK